MDISHTPNQAVVYCVLHAEKPRYIMAGRDLSTDFVRLFTSLSFKLKEKQNKQTIRPRASTVVVKTAAIPPDEERQQALIATMPLAGARCVIAL